MTFGILWQKVDENFGVFVRDSMREKEGAGGKEAALAITLYILIKAYYWLRENKNFAKFGVTTVWFQGEEIWCVAIVRFQLY